MPSLQAVLFGSAKDIIISIINLDTERTQKLYGVMGTQNHKP